MSKCYQSTASEQPAWMTEPEGPQCAVQQPWGNAAAASGAPPTGPAVNARLGNEAARAALAAQNQRGLRQAAQPAYVTAEGPSKRVALEDRGVDLSRPETLAQVGGKRAAALANEGLVDREALLDAMAVGNAAPAAQKGAAHFSDPHSGVASPIGRAENRPTTTRSAGDAHAPGRSTVVGEGHGHAASPGAHPGGGHAPEHGEHHDLSHGVAGAITAAHTAHAAAEIIHEGSEPLARLGMTKIVKGARELPSPAKVGAASVMGPLTVAGGILEIANGHQNPDQAEGALQMTQGTMSAIGGTATTLTPAAPLLGATAGPILSATGPAMAVGGLAMMGAHAGDEQVKKHGLLRDPNGKAESASDRLAREAGETSDWVRNKTGSATLGHAAALGQGWLNLPAAGATAVAGGVWGFGDWLGGKIYDWSH